ncbi:glycosyltransferase family protein [Flavobacterium capsici]|uniref:Uncharacterized protein n=1 Tax=Flavobacterium capsici TaxID=3075618 RepID=A0AA96JAK5_9FLAO|nr:MULTISPECIES: hypothetical protein [unclassified Flavobacterium]WNM20254.1 hypothetical protein RN608_06120 [Flavobacterium sp. PMR2A8]WNM21644.1 hypothetical protein RN605_13290 [Flavobacterium sp. PMTSA4]
MKFLIIEQDLRVSGTSQGIISRSFLSKLRMAYPNAKIDVVYLKSISSDDQLDLLPVDSIESHVLDLKIPFFTKIINKFYWRIFGVSLAIGHVNNVYKKYISKINYQNYDHIFIRSAGLAHETILGAKDLPILKKAIVNFHDPYPLFWYVGSNKELTKLEMYQMKSMFSIVNQAKTCMSSAHYMSYDLEFLYGTRKKFYTLPHQYSEEVFDLSDTKNSYQKSKKMMISYHGAIQFGRDIEILLDAYVELLEKNPLLKDSTEFVLRMKGINMKRLENKYKEIPNIILLETLNFSNSCYEQKHIADINIILENGPLYCNILVGKAPFLAELKKPILSLSPERSELRNIIVDDRFIANSNDKNDIKIKLENLILNRLESEESVFPFGDYFSNENFVKSLNEILSN